MNDGIEQRRDADTGSPLENVPREWYPGLGLLGIMAFMLWVRLRSYDRFVREGEVLFSGNDPYYHLREISYTARHWPSTMPYDVWTYYPFGTSTDQFGTLYDQLVATAALVVGLGSPDQQTIALTLLVSAAVFGTLTAVPVFFLGRRLGGTIGGLFGVVVLALLPGAFLSRSLVGSADHHAAEAFFIAVAVLGVVVALAVAERDKPVYELLVDRDLEALRSPTGWAVLSGVSIALYIWVWPPGVLLLGVAGVFFALKMSADYYSGRTPEPVGFVGAVAMGTVAVLTLLPLNDVSFSPTSFGLLQPLFAAAVAAGCVFLAWLAREWEDRDLDPSLYPVAVGAIALGGTGLLSVVAPDLFSTLVGNFRRFAGFSAGAGTRTIREAQPFLQAAAVNSDVTPSDLILQEYGLMFFTAMMALGYVVARPLLLSRDRYDNVTLLGGLLAIGAVWRFDVGAWITDPTPLSAETVTVELAVVSAVILLALLRGDHDAETMFVVVWSLFLVAAAFTQVRFNYYLALPVAVLNAYAMGELLRFVGLVDLEGTRVDEIEPYQIMAVMLALLVVLPVLVTPVTYAQQGQRSQRTHNAMEVGNSTAPGGITQWEGTFDWMRNNTPAEGRYHDPDGEPMDYYETTGQTDDYAYPAGSYGVMSWWDYGHWITVRGHRIPNANPFQQGATHAANFLLAPNESHANRVLARQGDDQEQTRYVVIDGQMASIYSKYSAPIVFYSDANVTSEDFMSERFFYQQGQQGARRIAFRLHEQRYYESMMVRLYRFHGSAVSPQPIVVEWDERQVDENFDPDGTIRVIRRGDNATGLRRFRTVQAARSYARNHSDAHLGGVGPSPQERVSALEHYRLVRVSESQSSTMIQGTRFEMQVLGQMRQPQYTPIRNDPSWVKTFERVDGATVRGQGPPNTTVRASVTMRSPANNRTFTYVQRARTDDEGAFEMTLPYSTTGYDQFGPEEGYTNVSVRAEGPYRFTTSVQVQDGNFTRYVATANVTEGQVVGENTSATEVALEEQVLGQVGGGTGGNESGGNGTDGNVTDGNATDGNATDGNATDGNATDVNVTGNASDGENASSLRASPGAGGVAAVPAGTDATGGGDAPAAARVGPVAVAPAAEFRR